jgi:two-component system cell cycle sensor histidine kinase/response regulator CckA
MFEVNTAIKLLIDPETGTIVDANPAASEFYGWPLDQLRGMQISRINQLATEELREQLDQAARTKAAPALHFKHRLADGSVRDVDVHSGPIVFDGKTLLFSIIHDVTERIVLEEKLRRAQRLDAIGRLAAGVANDFNNLLAVSLASVELAERKLGPDHPALVHLADVKRTVRHGAELTQQMLAFARQGDLEPMRVEIRQLIAQTAELLRSVLGDKISVTTELPPTLPAVRIDPGKLELAFINVALNARDAMPKGGRFTISARLMEDGRISITLEDTGCGMDAKTRSRAFEPFFTTKVLAGNSGLGLAAVYGLISQSGGEVTIDSTVGIGTCVSIVLPPHERTAPTPLRVLHAIMLVDDRDDVRGALATALEDAGLRVHRAASAREALAKLTELRGVLDAVISDVAMPERSGVELAGEIRTRWPALPVILMSGHRHAPTTGSISGWLAKPFSIDEALAMLERVCRKRSPAET